MYEKLEECPSCKHMKFNNFMICNDFTVTKESFALVKCCKCQLVFTNPRPTTQSIGKYYESDEYISHTNAATNIVNLAYKAVRKVTLRHKKRLITSYKLSGKILDFGCGTGHYLNTMKNSSWDTYGLEPDQKSRQAASNLIGKEIFEDISNISKKHSFDVITAWHVIEHVHDLTKTIRFLRDRLNEGGYMFIALPNHNSNDAMYYKEFWAAYDVPRHLYHFSQHSFLRLAKSLKLHLIDKVPMKFDSFYVSMLSEKYKTGQANYLNAIKAGVKSNKIASQKDGEYSSIIYVLSK